MGDNNNLITSLELRLAGVEASVNGMNRVAQASRNMGNAVESSSTHAVKGFAKFAGHMGGVGRYDFMFISGISDAIEQANGSWSRFLGAMGNTAAFAGAAGGIAAIVNVIGQLKETTEDYNKAVEETGNGQKMGMMSMLGQSLLYGATGGWMDLFGGNNNGNYGLQNMVGAGAKPGRNVEGTFKNILNMMKPDNWSDKFTRWFSVNKSASPDEMQRVAATLMAQEQDAKVKDRTAKVSQTRFAGMDEVGSVQNYKDLIAWQSGGVEASKDTQEKQLTIQERIEKILSDMRAKQLVPTVVAIQ